MKSMKIAYSLLLVLFSLLALPVFAQQTVDFPPADVANDEGGVQIIEGQVNYTVGFLNDFGAGSVVVLLNDASNVVDRNFSPDYELPSAYQFIGEVTSDPLTSPFTYMINLPIVPRGELRDVDNDAKDDPGVLVMTINVFTNMFDDPYWDTQREYGTGFNSTRSTREFELRNEIVGGKIVVWAPDDEQGFPSGYGDDGLLFTEDDPIVLLPAGYTVVDLDTAPFTFDRSRMATVDLIEADQSLQPADYSALSYSEAFEALIEQMRVEYAFSELKAIDWDALYEEFAPRFVEAEQNGDFNAYADALREFSWQIPDGHVGTNLPVPDAFFEQTDGGLGMAIREIDDGRVIVNFLTPDGPAEQAGIELRAEISEINGVPILDAIEASVPWSSPFSTYDRRRLQQLRYVVRFPVGSLVEITYQNPGSDKAEVVTLTAIAERESFTFSSFLRDAPPPGKLPVDFTILEDSGIAYVRISGFSQDPLIMLRLWEWMIDTLNQLQIPGVIIDIRDNGGGYNIDNVMASYFFNEELVVGNDATYYEDQGFVIDPLTEERLSLPDDGRYYPGPIAVIVGPNCQSACESFAYIMSLEDRAAIVGHYTTSGLGGSITPVIMPDGVRFQFTISRALTADGDIRIEGIGVPPTLRVPVNEETLFAEGDVLLDAAIEYLQEASAVSIEGGGEIVIGSAVEGELTRGGRIRYTLNVPADVVLDIVVSDETGELDTILRIYLAGREEQVAAENDDDILGDTTNSALRQLQVPGGLVLILEVGGFLDSYEGTFTLSVTESNPQ